MKRVSSSTLGFTPVWAQGRLTYVDFNNNGVNPKRQPSGCSERDSQRRRNLERIVAFKVWADNHSLIDVGAVIEGAATWVHGHGPTFTEHGIDLDTRVCGGERFIAADDSGG